MIHPLIEKKVDADINVVASEMAPPVFVEGEKPTYTKTAINRMSTSELQKLAKKLGVGNKDDSGSELKKKLIEHFGL